MDTALTLVFDFKYDGRDVGKGGTGTLQADGIQIAQGQIERAIPIPLSLDEGLDVGNSSRLPRFTLRNFSALSHPKKPQHC